MLSAIMESQPEKSIEHEMYIRLIYGLCPDGNDKGILYVGLYGGNGNEARNY